MALVSFVAISQGRRTRTVEAESSNAQPSKQEATRPLSALASILMPYNPTAAFSAPVAIGRTNVVQSSRPAVKARPSFGLRTINMQEPVTTVTKPGDEQVGDGEGADGIEMTTPPEQQSAPVAAPSAASYSEADKQLLSATMNGNGTLILEALKQGANPNVADPRGRTALHFTAGLGLAPASALLIHFGAQLDAPDMENLRPIHMAAGYGNAQTLRLLVAAGADTEVRGMVQGTPKEVVQQLGDYAMQEFMNRKGMDKIMKKKDAKLEELKACMRVFAEIEEVRKEGEDWDKLMTEALQAIALKK